MSRTPHLEHDFLTLLATELGPGQPLPVERQLSARLGVARMTLRPLLERYERLGLISLRGGRRHLTAASRRSAHPHVLILTLLNTLAPLPTIAGAQEVSVVESALSQLHAAGMRVVTQDPNQLGPEAALRLMRAGPQVVIIAPDVTLYPQAGLLNTTCLKHGVPVIAIAEPGVFPGASTIRHDHAAGAAALTHWLLAQGHRELQQIWCYAEPTAWLNERDLGHRKAMASVGLKARPAICTGHLPTTPKPEPQADIDAMTFSKAVRGIAGWLPEALCHQPAATGFLVSHDARVPAMHAALRLYGRVPGRDVLVAGYDHLWRHEPSIACESTPPAITIDKLHPDISRAMISEVTARLAGGQAQDILVPGRLIVTASALAT